MSLDEIKIGVSDVRGPATLNSLSLFVQRENEVEEVKEEGPKEMTLDEWKAMQDKERAKVDFNIRKANEGADWNKGFVLHKSKAEVSQSLLHFFF